MPPEAPAAPVTPVIDPNNPVPPPPISPDDDPNLKLQQMVSRRKAVKAPETTTDPAKSSEPDIKPDEPKPTGDVSKLSGVLAKALNFREDKPAKDTKNPDKAPEKPAETPKEPAKTIVKAKKVDKPAQLPSDPVKIAAAAATAAVKAMVPEAKPAAPVSTAPEETLKAEDLHEYQVAKHLAESNPRYKDAPKIVLEHVKKAEAYASRWEEENKGKTFDPNDDEHNEFYDGLEKPWTDFEFRSAETELAAERILEKRSQGSEKKIRELETENARIALAPVVERTYMAAAGLLAKKVGDDVHEKITKGSFDKFSEEDPITADALASTIGPLQPVIEAAIQLDDPKGRFPFDPKNAVHLEWNRIMLEKEAELEGATDGDGRKFATRGQYAQMTEGQRAKHFYLTTEHLLEEIINDASETVKKTVETEKDRQKKIALSLGFVPKTASSNGASASGAPKAEETTKPEGNRAEVTKPVSPTAGAGAKIDDKGNAAASGTNKLLETTAGILFRR